MRKFTQFVLITAAIMAAPSAFAEMKIAVLNYQMALLESDAAKQYAVDAEKKFGPQLNKLKNLERDAKALQDKLVSNGSKMSQGDREKAELDFKQKARDFQFQSKELNESKAAADRDMLKKLCRSWTRPSRRPSRKVVTTWSSNVAPWSTSSRNTTSPAR